MRRKGAAVGMVICTLFMSLSGCASGPKSMVDQAARTSKNAKPQRLAKKVDRPKESVCGNTVDWFEAEEFRGSRPISSAVMQNAGRRTVRLVLKPADTMRDIIMKMFPGSKSEDIELGKYQQYAGAGWCTGTLLNRSTVITAAHCFAPGSNKPTVYIDNIGVELVPDQLARLFEVQAGYQFIAGTKTRRPGSRSAVQSIREYGPSRVGALDYAIIKIAPFESVGQPMPINMTDLPIDSAVAIVHHPLGLPKKISIGLVDAYTHPDIYYSKADTEFASSGAGVLDKNGKLIGIHTTGGCETAGNNVGVTISAISSSSNMLRR